MASCRTPISETYDIVKLQRYCKFAVGLVISASSVSTADPKECVGDLKGSPKTLEKPTGSIMACAPVATADIANMTLIVLKVSRR